MLSRVREFGCKDDQRWSVHAFFCIRSHQHILREFGHVQFTSRQGIQYVCIYIYVKICNYRYVDTLTPSMYLQMLTYTVLFFFQREWFQRLGRRKLASPPVQSRAIRAIGKVPSWGPSHHPAIELSWIFPWKST